MDAQQTGNPQIPPHRRESPVQIGEVTTYWLDTKDLITAVSSSWNHFALNNNAGKNSLAQNVIGQNIYSFIISDPTRMYLQILIQQARVLGNTVAKKYRCDSPQLKRYMEMRITPEQTGQIRLDHLLERVEPFVRPISFYPASSGGTATAYRCSICARLYLAGCWVMPDDAITEGLISLDAPLPVIYTVCPVCQPSSPDKE